MRKGILILLNFIFLLSVSYVCKGQSDLPMQSWFEKVQNGNAFEVSAHFLLEDEEVILLSYVLEVFRNDERQIELTKQGKFLAVPQLPLLLAHVNFQWPVANRGKVVLKIVLENKVILEEELALQTNEVVANREQAPEVVALQAPEIVKPLEPAEQNKIVETEKKTKVDKVSSPFFEDAEIGGLIIDESRTKLGRDFYEQFFSKWIAPAGISEDYIVRIKELPSFGRISRISVLVNEQQLMTRSISPNFGQLEANVNASVRGVRSYLVRRKQMSKDLENEDQLGSGIF